MNYKFGEMQKEREDAVKVKLLALGYSDERINEFQKSYCVACNNPRDMCQCPFAGSAHPTDEERFTALLKNLGQSTEETPAKACAVCNKLGQQPNCYREIFSDLLVRDDCNSDVRAHSAIRTNFCPNCGRKL